MEIPLNGGRLDVGSVRRRQIVGVVRAIIASEGIEAVTFQRIADDLGTSRGIITYHYKNKEAILHEALQEAIRDASRITTKIFVQNHDLLDLINRVAALARDGSDWWHIYVAFLAKSADDPFYRDEIANADRTYRENLRDAAGSPARAVVALGLMKGIALQLMVDGDLPVDEIAVEVRSLSQAW